VEMYHGQDANGEDLTGWGYLGRSINIAAGTLAVAGGVSATGLPKFTGPKDFIGPHRPPLAGVLDGHQSGQGFTGVFDSNTGRTALRPSSSAAVLPDGHVPRRGGHAIVSSELGGDSTHHQGFAAILQSDGSLKLTWRSGTLNPPPNFVVAPANRGAITQAVETATGRTTHP
jgi:hypothetical protein